MHEPEHNVAENRKRVSETGVLDTDVDAAGWWNALPGASPAEVITGHLDGIDAEGRILFVAEPGDGQSVPVVIGTTIPDGVLVRSARNQRRAMVIRTSEKPPRLVLIGRLRERVTAAARDAAPGHLEVEVDGETIRLTAEHEIELRCGNASILLRRSGRVILKGTHVVTSSTGPLKLKGATVDIN